MKHTPGPWKVKQGLGAPDIVSKERLVARALYHMGSEDREVDSNARLIAAAPELLAACEAAHDWLTQFCEHAPIVFGGETELAEQLLAALAKAVDYS